MAFDGITIAGITAQMNQKLINGRIYKIAQPESDELLLTIKNNRDQYRLLLSADASLPLIYLTEANKTGPLTAPNFCMLLRKHIQNGRIVSITQPGLERIVRLEIEHLNDLGDLCRKFLIAEIMGKHSNIIFCDDKDCIIDSIKHISLAVSSVREVLPGRDYFIPQTQDKLDPFQITGESFASHVLTKPMPLFKALYSTLTGFSPAMAEELCCRACLDSARPGVSLSGEEGLHLFHNLEWLLNDVKAGSFSPGIVYEKEIPVEFSVLALKKYEDLKWVPFPSVSEMLEHYYAEKNIVTRIRQKSSDLRRLTQTVLERNVKKYDLQLKQLKDTEKKDRYKVYGELINAYGYGLSEGAKALTAENYHTGDMVTVPLDPLISPSENAKKYFDRYGKLKRTEEALGVLIQETGDEVRHLESILASLDIAQKEEDLTQIREELADSGYIRRRGAKKKAKITSRPFHYISSDGFHMYVGKNNYQNDDLTFKFATGNDWWFHAKAYPGSHVIVKAADGELPDSTFEEAARLAAYYSKGRGQEKVEVDYVQKKHVKKPGGAKPGFVVYYTNYSMMIDSKIDGIKEYKDA